MDKNKQRFGIEDYKRIHDLVYKFQSGSKEAAEELMESFKPFLNKYIKLIVYGTHSIENYSTRSFIKLFVDNDIERSKISSYFANPKGKLIANEVASKISKIFTNNSEEDIEQEVYTVFLFMCSKYKDTKPSFHHHVKRNYHYYLYRNLEKLSKDPVARRYYSSELQLTLNKYNVSFTNAKFSVEEFLKDESAITELDDVLNKIEYQYNIKTSKTTAIKANKNITIYDDEFLDMNWINGITCNKLFKVLTPFERNMLLMWYIENKTDTDIANIYGVCRGTINKKRTTARYKLEEIAYMTNNIVK